MKPNEVCVEIQLLSKHGLSLRRIASEVGCAVNTVRRHLALKFCATMGYSRASYVEFVSDMNVATLIGCHERAFAAFGGVPRKLLYDNMKTVVIERDVYGKGVHRYHVGFLDFAKHSGFRIKLGFVA